MVGQQPGRILPVARRLGVPDGLDHVAMPANHPAARRCSAGTASGIVRRSSSRSRSPNSWWKRNQVRSGSSDTTNAFASSSSSRIRSEPGHPVSRSASSPLTRSSRQVRRSRSGRRRAGGPASRRAGTPRPSGWCRRTPSRTAPGRGDRPGTAPRGAVPRPTLGPLVQQRRPGLRQRDIRETQVVLDPRALPGLPAGRELLNQHGAQTLRGAVHRSAEPGRAAADNTGRRSPWTAWSPGRPALRVPRRSARSADRRPA